MEEEKEVIEKEKPQVIKTVEINIESTLSPSKAEAVK